MPAQELRFERPRLRCQSASVSARCRKAATGDRALRVGTGNSILRFSFLVSLGSTRPTPVSEGSEMTAPKRPFVPVHVQGAGIVPLSNHPTAALVTCSIAKV